MNRFLVVSSVVFPLFGTSVIGQTTPPTEVPFMGMRGALDIEIGMFATETVDGRAIPIVENTDNWGTWEYESPFANFMTYGSPISQVKVRCGRFNDGPMQIQFRDSAPGVADSAWLNVTTGTGDVTWSESYTWPSDGEHQNLTRLLTWGPDTNTDMWDCWRGQFPVNNVTVDPFNYSGIYFFADCMAAQASDWEGIIAVFYNVLENGTQVEHRDNTLPGNQPPGVLINRWTPNDPAGAPAMYPRFESDVASTKAYPMQFFVQERDPIAAGNPWTIVATTFFDMPSTAALYALIEPKRLFKAPPPAVGDQGNEVAVGEKIIHSFNLSTYLMLDNRNANNNTDSFGFRVIWCHRITQTINNNRVPPNTTFAVPNSFMTLAYTLGENPPSGDVSWYDTADQAPKCWMWAQPYMTDRTKVP